MKTLRKNLCFITSTFHVLIVLLKALFEDRIPILFEHKRIGREKVDVRNFSLRHVADVRQQIPDALDEDLEWYGMDWYAASPHDDGISLVTVTTKAEIWLKN